MIIRDKWYVIYGDDNNIISYGDGTGFRVDSGSHQAAEFDTEAEMLQHISDNELILPEIENEEIN